MSIKLGELQFPSNGILTIGLIVGSFFAPVAVNAQESWRPTQPSRIVVPYSAGGVTDSVVRVLAADIAPMLGQDVVVINQPGASGSIGSRSVFESERDGHTWLANAVRDLGTYPITGLLDATIDDWHIFTAIGFASVLSVPSDSVYEDAPSFLAALADDATLITIASSGPSSSGALALSAVLAANGGDAQLVTYEGEAPAILSTVRGETDATMDSSFGQADMLRNGLLRPLAVVGDFSINLEGVGTIPAITDFLSDLPPTENVLAIELPKGTPLNIIEALEEVWPDLIAGSEELIDLCEQRGCTPIAETGDLASESARPIIQAAAWRLAAQGNAVVDPASLGIEPLE